MGRGRWFVGGGGGFGGWFVGVDRGGCETAASGAGDCREAMEGLNSVDMGGVGKTRCKTLGWVRRSVWRVMGDCGSND